jgi:A/G-specific adenine glycosylase
LKLPGVGPYTAGAIASICFDRPVPAVDGNVLRIISRLAGISDPMDTPAMKKRIAASLEQVYPKGRSGAFTQSLMELGATVCMPKGAARCNSCPLAFLCRAYQTGAQATLPIKAKKMPRKKEQKTVFILRCADKIALRQREAGGLLAGLWEFPNAAGNLMPEQAEEILARWGVSVTAMTESIRKKHIFTHIEWAMTSYRVVCENMPNQFLWVTKEKLAGDMALPSAFRAFCTVI